MSFGNQVDKTILKFYQDVQEVFICEIDPKGYNLKIENDFPHFYDQKLLYGSVIHTEKKKILNQ